MKRLLSQILFFVISLSLLSAPVWAKHKKGHGDTCKMGDTMQTCPMMDKLQLTDAQTKDVEAIQTKYKKQMMAHKGKIKILKKKLDTAFRSSAKSDAVQKIYNDLQAEKNAKHDLRFAKCLEIRALLTKEQRKNFAPCSEKGHGSHGNMHMCEKKS